MAWCAVCDDGSLEGYPSMVYCRECWFSFHKHCAHSNEDEDEDEDEDENEDEVSSSRCPRCQGSYIDSDSKAFADGFTDGYCQALKLAKVETLTKPLAIPLLLLKTHAGIILDLPKIQKIDDLVISDSCANTADLLTSKYRLAIQFEDIRLSGITEILTCKDVMQSIRAYLSGVANDIDISGKYLAKKGALKPLLGAIHRIRLGIRWNESTLEQDRRCVIDYVSEDKIACENNCEIGDELIQVNGHDLNIGSLMKTPIAYFTKVFNEEGKLWLTFRKESGDEFSFEVTEDELEFPKIKHDVVINDDNLKAILQIASKLHTLSWNRKQRYPNSLQQPHLTRLSKATTKALSKHQGELYLDGLTELSDAAAEALSKHQGELSLNGLTELSDEAAEALCKHKGKLYLRGLTELSDAAAEALCKHQGELYPYSLTELSDAAAEALSKHQGSLNLCRITELSDAAAEALSKHQGDLWLGGLTELSDAAAEALSKHQGGLSLNGLTELSDAAAEALSKHQGELYLRGLTILSDRGADCFSAYNGWMPLNRLIELTPAIARLMSSKAMNEDDEICCDFDRLETISPEVAGILGRGKYYMLCLYLVNGLSPDAARGLGEFEGSYLALRGFSSLSAELARVLAQAKAGTLSLGVEKLNDEACKALSTFQGELALEDLQTVSPTGASWLLKQGRCLKFCSLDLGSIANREK